MSLDPEPALRLNPADEQAAAPSATARHPILTACYSLVALATGLTLAIAPWVDSWNFNYLQSMNPTLEYLWNEPLLRGSLAALGLLNVLIAVHEMVGLLRAGERQGS